MMTFPTYGKIIQMFQTTKKFFTYLKYSDHIRLSDYIWLSTTTIRAWCLMFPQSRRYT
jgi:hypothetical protein